MKKHLLLVALIGLCQAQAAHANADAGMERLLALSLEELMAIKIRISTNTEQTTTKAPSVVSVITAEDIKATGATNLVEILQSVPGIYIRANLFGNRPLVTFRGAAGTHTLLMVNGAPIKDLVWNSGIFWRGLPTSMIERVEIIRGPGSALFGSDASAGVINVITRTAGRIEQSEAGLRAGSFDTQTGWMQHGTNWNGFDIGVTAEISRTDGHDPLIAADNQTSRDRSFGTQVSYAPAAARFGWESTDLRFSMARGPWRLHADYARHSDVALGLVGVGVLDPLTRGADTRYNLDLFYNDEAFAQDWGLNAELRYAHLDYTSGDGFHERPPGYRDATGTYPDGQLNLMRSAERRLSFEASGLYSGFRHHALRLGGGHVVYDLYRVEQYANFGIGPDGSLLPAGGPLVALSDSPYAFAPEKARDISYLFLQDVWTLADAWELTAGARYDHYSDFGGSLNPRLALVWQSTERLTTKLMYGQAFRAPSYLELYSGAGGTRPNAALEPERSRTWDLAFSYSASKDLKLGLDLYQFTQSNLIGADAANQFQNIGEYTARGVELEAQWQAARTLRVSGNLTRRREDDSPFRTFNVPRQKAYLRADWAFLPQWNWNVQATRTGRHQLPASARKPLDAYTWVDTTVRHALGRDWELAASIRNLFDVDAREYAGGSLPDFLPLPRRNFYAELRYRF